MENKQIVFNMEKIKEHWTKERIVGFANELDLTQIGALFYLYFYNFVSICPKDLTKNNGRAMYVKFAQGVEDLIRDFCTYTNAEDIERIKAQYEAVVQQNRDLQAELQPIRQPYFKGLSAEVITELAKSQLKTVVQNINAEALIDYILETIENASDVNALRIIKQEIEKYREFEVD